jgi:uncharacterized protein (TIGR03086 family)
VDTITLLDRAHVWSAGHIAAISRRHLTAPTPCPPWNLRELLHHLMQMLLVISNAAEGRPIDASWRDNGGKASAVDALGESPIAAFETMTTRLATAWRKPGALDQTCRLSFGAVPAMVVTDIQLLEVVVHGWDISQAIGRTAVIPDDLAAAVHTFAQGPVIEGKRGTAFAAPQEIAETASASDRLLAFLGRRAGRT